MALYAWTSASKLYARHRLTIKLKRHFHSKKLLKAGLKKLFAITRPWAFEYGQLVGIFFYFSEGQSHSKGLQLFDINLVAEKTLSATIVIIDSG